MKYAVAYKVYETTEYDDFNFLEENRGISDNHVANLIKSLNKGYEMPPIIVDEDMNVIDGQHRLTAHKKASKPVRFVIQQNIKDDTLQRANTDISKWRNNDHLMYHVKKKNENYIKLLEYITYAEVTITTGMSILGKSSDSKVKTKARVLQEGLFTVTNEHDAYNFANEILLRVRMDSPSNKIVSAMKQLYDAGLDNKRLVASINAVEDELQLINKIPDISKAIIKTYNRNLNRSEQVNYSMYKNGTLKLEVSA